MILLIIASLGLSPHTLLSERVDLIELNHTYDKQGEYRYTQVILWEWSPDCARHHVIAWVMVHRDVLPPRRISGREYVFEFYDRADKVRREIRSKCFRETWTQFDPERKNQQLFELEYRKGLRNADRSNAARILHHLP